MRQWLAALVPWMALTAAWADEPVAVQVDYTYLGTFTDGSVRIDDECWVTPALLTSWGYSVTPSGDRITVSYAGRVFDLAYLRVDTVLMVSLHEACRWTGAAVSWDEEGDTLIVRSQLRNVEELDGSMRIDTTLPVRAEFFKLTDPDRFVIDLHGARVINAAIGAMPKSWRIGQFEQGVARIVVQDAAMVNQFVPTMEPARSFVVYFGPEPYGQGEAPTNGGDEGSVGGIKSGEGSEAPVEFVTTSTISMPNLAREDEHGALLMLPYTGVLAASPSAKYLDPQTIEIVVPNALPSRPGSVQAYESEYVDSAASSSDGENVTVTFALTGPLAFELKHNDRIVTLRLFRPAEASGKLAAKVIVVDAGHGGQETGTTWGDLHEKDINLKIAQMVSERLTEAGASVIMIRNEDAKVPLLTRPETANQSDADLYLSIHINSNRTVGSRSGGITFFHMQDPISMLLARCIQTEIASVSEIPDLGVWSDSKIYRTKGLAVLRLSNMPAVLIELGFINHAHDRARVQRADFQSDVAAAIVRGVRVFLGDDDVEPQ